MPNTINLRLLDNKNIIAEMNGISLAQENSYKIIAGEENATIFKIISKPTQYEFAQYTVEMVNSQGYGIDETDIIQDTFALPKGMAVAGYGWVQIRAYYTNEEGKEEKVPFMTLKVKVWNTIPTWKEHISEGSGGSGIRTLDTTPTTTTEGYAGEIVQVSDGASYQCTAVADGVYTWVKMIKQTDTAKSGYGKANFGLINFYPSYQVSGIKLYQDGPGGVFPFIDPASNASISDRTENVAAPLISRHINTIVKSALTGDKRIGQGAFTGSAIDRWAVAPLTTEEKQEACEVLGAIKLYVHCVSYYHYYEQSIEGGGTYYEREEVTLIIMSIDSTAYQSVDDLFNALSSTRMCRPLKVYGFWINGEDIVDAWSSSGTIYYILQNSGGDPLYTEITRDYFMNPLWAMSDIVAEYKEA